MEIRIKNYIIRPDNGSTWSLTKEMVRKEGDNIGETYEGNTIYPKDLKTCIIRIREDFIREDKTFCETLDNTIQTLVEIDEKLKQYIEKAIIDLK